MNAPLERVWDAWSNPDVPGQTIDDRMSDGRQVEVQFEEDDGGVLVNNTFDAESENPPEMQRTGWQAILDNFGRYVEGKR